tara:strand:- start:3046 stop:3840 length:795 start_codon:yes stop_codon:yes gene_type:complete
MKEMPNICVGQPIGRILAAAPLNNSLPENQNQDFIERANALMQRFSLSNNISDLTSKFLGGGVKGNTTGMAARSASQAAQMAALVTIVGGVMPAALPVALAAYSSYKTSKLAASLYSTGKSTFSHFCEDAKHRHADAPKSSFASCLVESVRKNPLLAAGMTVATILAFAGNDTVQQNVLGANEGQSTDMAAKIAKNIQGKIKPISDFFAKNSVASVLSVSGCVALKTAITAEQPVQAPSPVQKHTPQPAHVPVTSGPRTSMQMG